MGLESSNYLFRFSKERSVNEIIESIRFDIVLREGNGVKLVKQGPDHWIDFLTLSEDIKELFIRIALCNSPRAFTEELKKCLDRLFLLDTKGILLDFNSKSRYRVLDGKAWKKIIGDYQKRKTIFTNIYGSVELPVSAEEFYRQISSK